MTSRLPFTSAVAALLVHLVSSGIADAKETVPSEPGGAYPDGFCGTERPVKPCAAEKIGEHGPQPRRKLFLNRSGGPYYIGPRTDAATNTVGTISAMRPGTIPPLSGSDADWQLLVDCVRDRYKRFNIDVVDAEPAATEKYEEVVIGGKQADINYSPLMPKGGVAFNDLGCTAAEHGVGFVFVDNMVISDEGNRQWLCIAASHESGHLFGLEHEGLPTDIMSYSQDPFGKEFQDQLANCGEYETSPTRCSCNSNSSTNSKERLDDLVGPNEQEPPVVSITSPLPDAHVGPAFVVKATATDNSSVESLELWIDGQLADSDVNEPFELHAPANITLGAHTVEVHAIDKSYNQGTAMQAVTVDPGCASDTDCSEGQVCANNACLSDIGNACHESSDCATGLCASTGPTNKVCSQLCTAGAADQCPSGFSCRVENGGQAKCWAENGGGCGVVTGQGRESNHLPWLSATAFGLAMFFMRRRRR